jgi:5-methylcytosine-specific restriction enzyme A
VSEFKTTASQRFYASKQWRTLRKAYLEEHPLCEYHLRRDQTVAGYVVDHKVPHRLDEAEALGGEEQIAAAYERARDASNLQTLCKQCHDSDKQRLEKSGRVAGCASDGTPLDPRHHWNLSTGGG